MSTLVTLCLLLLDIFNCYFKIQERLIADSKRKRKKKEDLECLKRGK